MSLFSQRKGYKTVSKAFQRESLNEALRNQLWSALTAVIWEKWSPSTLDRWSRGIDENSDAVEYLSNRLWIYYFKKPIDRKPVFKTRSSDSVYEFFRHYFFNAKWYEVYDFIEFVLKNTPVDWAVRLKEFCNQFLESENATYRIVDNQVTEITNENEIASIEDAIASPLESVSIHLKRALELMSDKKEPDYRNSIKESISAVESCCQYITNDKQATLGEALKKIKATTGLHGALEKGFRAIYGYTSDSGGIRHALIDSSETPSNADSKFMVVACSAFINFLLTKVAEENIKIK